MKKLTKAKYPQKTSINLAMSENEQGNTKVMIAGFAVFMAALVVFVKFGVADPISRASETESKYNSIQSQLDELNEGLADYNDVAEQYSHYSNGYLNEEELLVTSRVDVLNLLESCVMNRADIQSVSITGNTVDVTLSETNLVTVSRVVAALQEDERTGYVTVSTASTNSSTGANSQLVTANIIIELASPSDGETNTKAPSESTAQTNQQGNAGSTDLAGGEDA